MLLARYLWSGSSTRRNKLTGELAFTFQAFLCAADDILCTQATARKRLDGESQKPGWGNLQGGAHRLLGVIFYYINTNGDGL